ncbi:hypothetical protein VC273_21825 [Xanthomonas nasturtii]|uniref:hypothetical protein n=1 Tax=Xanthomonas TaxID=338 RepID=UPI002B227522|nr:hypothetical protein [Xanthomonas nasturtii]MEA9558430.1 hypothetical protein [Xanthomonas nasturtii]
MTRAHDYGACQQLLTRSWLRDGKAVYQDLSGALEHGGGVPLAWRCLEADIVPLDFNDPERNILQIEERNAWDGAVAYHVY